MLLQKIFQPIMLFVLCKSWRSRQKVCTTHEPKLLENSSWYTLIGNTECFPKWFIWISFSLSPDKYKEFILSHKLIQKKNLVVFVCYVFEFAKLGSLRKGKHFKISQFIWKNLNPDMHSLQIFINIILLIVYSGAFTNVRGI